MDESFVTANVMIKCDASWTSDVYDNFNQYVRGTKPHNLVYSNVYFIFGTRTRLFTFDNEPLSGKLKSSTTGYGIQALPQTDVRLGYVQF